MKLVKGYLKTELPEIKRRKEQLDIAIDLIKYGLADDHGRAFELGLLHTVKYIKIDVENLSVMGLIHWSRVSEKFFKRYYALAEEHDRIVEFSQALFKK